MMAGTGTFTRAAGIRLLDQAESTKGFAKPISLRDCVSNVILIESTFRINSFARADSSLVPTMEDQNFLKGIAKAPT